MSENNTPENITELAHNQIFVFGSNLAGRHGAGAALLAKNRFGAMHGVGAGFTGNCYAIPTKDSRLRVLPLDTIAAYVSDFLEDARRCPHLEFLVTKIGCGLAGYDPQQIAPLFAAAPENVFLPKVFQASPANRRMSQG